MALLKNYKKLLLLESNCIIRRFSQRDFGRGRETAESGGRPFSSLRVPPHPDPITEATPGGYSHAACFFHHRPFYCTFDQLTAGEDHFSSALVTDDFRIPSGTARSLRARHFVFVYSRQFVEKIAL